MQNSAQQIAEALREIPCIGDGDTGYGNAVNVKRTVKGYAQVHTLIIMHDVCSSTRQPDLRSQFYLRLAWLV